MLSSGGKGHPSLMQETLGCGVMPVKKGIGPQLLMLLVMTTSHFGAGFCLLLLPLLHGQSLSYSPTAQCSGILVPAFQPLDFALWFTVEKDHSRLGSECASLTHYPIPAPRGLLCPASWPPAARPLHLTGNPCSPLILGIYCFWHPQPDTFKC